MGDRIIPPLNRLILAASQSGLPIFFTRDWHPSDHISFHASGGPWPPHCIIDTKGASFHSTLAVPAEANIVSKGSDPQKEAYSGFQGTDLLKTLKALGAEMLYVAGLATDYCVKETVLDGRRAGFDITVIEDCMMPVEAKQGDGQRAVAEMRGSGAHFVTSAEAIEMISGA